MHRPDRQKLQWNSNTNNVHLATSARLICAFCIEGVPQLIVYLSHTDTFISHSHPTSNDRSGKARVRWKWRAAMGHGQSVGSRAQCCDVIVTRSSNQPTSFLKLRRDMLYAWQKRTAPWGEEVEVASAIRVLCVLKRAYKTGIAALSVAILCTLHSLCAWYGQFIKLGPGFFVRILLCFALLPIVHGRWKLWFRHAICHNSSMDDTMVSRGNVGWTTSGVDIPTHARIVHNRTL